MNNQKVFVMFALLIASMSGTSAFAQSIESIVVTTDKETYSDGETIMITGEVRDRLSGFPVSLQVISSNGNLVTVKQLEIGEDNKFSTDLATGGNLWKSSGEYTIKVLYGTESRTNETAFGFGSSMIKDDVKDVGPTIQVDNTDMAIEYNISNGKITSVTPIEDANSLIIAIESNDAGEISLTLPRELIDAKIGDADDDFFVIINGEEVEFEETTTLENRTISIPFSEDTEEIEIIGTYVVPEFGSIAVLILAVAIVSLVAITSKTKLNILR